MAAGELTVEVRADTKKLESGLRGAVNKTEQAADQMGKAGSSAAGFADKAIKGLAVLGAVEAGFKGLHVAVAGIKGVMAAMRGDADAADKSLRVMAETVKQLPFGIGAVASAIEGLVGEIIGLTAKQEELQRQMKILARMDARAEKFKKWTEHLDEGNLALQRRLELLNEENEHDKKHLSLVHERFRLEEELHDMIMDNLTLSGRRQNDIDQVKERIRLIDAIIEKEQAIAAEARRKAEAEERAAREAERQLRAKEAQEKLEKERLAREREMKRLADERAAAEKEMLEAQQSAQSGLAGAIGTVDTAAGAFTVGIDAQLNETKLMRSVSEKSHEVLKGIKDTLERREAEPMMM